MLVSFLKGAVALAVIRRVSTFIKNSDLLREEREVDGSRRWRDEGERELARPRIAQVVERKGSAGAVNGLDEGASTSAVHGGAEGEHERYEGRRVSDGAPGYERRRRSSKGSKSPAKRLQRTSPNRIKLKERERRVQAARDGGPEQIDEFERVGEAFEVDREVEEVVEEFLAPSPPTPGETGYHPRRQNKAQTRPFDRDNSPEVVKIKVDLLESLKGNLESLKENLQDTVDSGNRVMGRGGADEVAAGATGDQDSPGAQELSFSLPRPIPREAKARARARRASAPAFESKERARRSSNPPRPRDQPNLSPQGNGVRPSTSESSGAREPAPESPERPRAPRQPSSVSVSESHDEAASDGYEYENSGEEANTPSPTYIVHEKQVLPIGYRKKKQKLLKVSTDSPDWMKNPTKTLGRGRNGGRAEDDFRIPGAKTHVKCRYVTQVSDSSPDWFRTKFATSHYQPVRENPDQGESGTLSPRKLTFAESRPL